MKQEPWKRFNLMFQNDIFPNPLWRLCQLYENEKGLNKPIIEAMVMN